MTEHIPDITELWYTLCQAEYHGFKLLRWQRRFVRHFSKARRALIEGYKAYPDIKVPP